MAQKTFAQLTAQTDVQDADLLAIYRGAGPLKKITAANFTTYVTTGLTAGFLVKASNLSDLTNAGTARTNLGLGSSALLASTALLLVANNLSDLASAASARTNLGLGSAALLASTATALTANNLSDLANAGTARTNLGLGTAATQATTAFLQAANNLSDLASAATARTNLGLASAALVATGTSGATIPLLSTANTWGAKQTFITSGASAASLTLPHGSAPSSPVNGDMWTTTSAVYVRINGVTVQLGDAAAAGVASFNSRTGSVTLTSGDVTTALAYTPANKAGDTFSGALITAASASGGAGLRLPHGAAPTSPVNGDLWTTTSAAFARINGATKTLMATDGNTTGSAATLTTARTLAVTGDLTWTSPSFDGSANVTAAGTLATVNSNVGTFGDSLNVSQVTLNGKGLATAGANVAIATMAGDAGAGGTKGLVPAPATGDAAKALIGAGTFQPVACRAWVRFTVSGGVVTVQASYNVSGVSRTATGKFTVSFTTVLTDANYCAQGMARRTSGSTNCMNCNEDRANPQTASNFFVVITNNGDTAEDPAAASLTFFGN